MIVQVGGNTVSIQVQSSGLGAALDISRSMAAEVAAAAASAAAAATAETGAEAAQAAAAASASAAAATLANAALKSANLSDMASASTALSNIGGAAKSANLSDLASASTARTNLGGTATGVSVFTAADAAAARTAIGIDATNTPYTSTGIGAVERSVASILNDYTNSVISFGAVGDGTTNDTVAVQAAFTAFGNRPIFFPPNKTYRLGAVGGLGAAGGGVMGVAGYDTIIKPISGFTGSIFYNQNNATSSSAYGHIHDIRFDLNSENCVAIDLSQCDTFVVERVNGRGGPNKAGAVGTLVKFGAPLDNSSYNNVIRDCGAEFFAKAVIFGLNANQNRIEGGTFTNNDIAIDCAPGGALLRPQVLGVRLEDNNVGIKEGAQGGVYLGYFEAHTTGDFSFTTDSNECVILAGTTSSTTSTRLHNRSNAANLRCLSDDMDYYDIQASTSRIRQEQGRKARTPSGRALTSPIPSGVGFTDLHVGPFLIANGSGVSTDAGLYGVGAAGTGLIHGLLFDSSGRLNIPGYNEETSSYTRIPIGPNFSFNPGSGLEYNGVKVLGAQGAALPANATDLATALTLVNAIKARLVAHGIVAT